MSNDLNDLIIEIGGWDYLKKQEKLLIFIMNNDLIKIIENIGGWDTAKKLEEKMREEQELQNQQQQYADEEEGLLDEIQF